jgi:ABC-2 type transport system ATP-binding protein
MPENIIEVKNLKKTYSPKKNPVHALRGISFEVKKGEIFGILGVNGAGKSTTLNILIGLLSASSGSVKIFGRNFLGNETAIKQKMNIATAYADLANNLTIYRNLKIYALMYGVANYQEKILGLMHKFGIFHLRNKWFGDLSAGEKTRVNLCKGLVNSPELLLLDEPTASLDPSIAAHVRKLLLELQHREKLTILLSSHNMPEVEQMCDRVALLHNGEIYRIDTPENLIKFLKVPSMEQVFLKLAEGEFEE